MALIPLLLDYLDEPRPSRLLDQHFGYGLGPDDLLAPLTFPRDVRALMRTPSGTAGYYRPWRSNVAQQDAGSTVAIDKNKFQVNLDVQQFRPDEITVKVTGDNTVTVEGKHEEKPDEHGYISRHFVRRYILPKGHNIDKIESKLSSDGVLSITAPRVDQEDAEHRHVPITQTGQPLRAAEAKAVKAQENGAPDEEEEK